VEIQADEYGGGRAERVHAQLFADAMAALGLDPGYGAYLDVVPGVTLATVNLMSLMGLHRRWRGGIVGHLALFEMTSSVPNGRYARGLRRLGLEAATPFFDEHVEADAVHENIAAVDLAGGLARAEPALTGEILWGARALVELEARWSRHLLASWEAGVSSLAEPLESSAPA
jgi:Iron-containing redox enzyme